MTSTALGLGPSDFALDSGSESRFECIYYKQPSRRASETSQTNRGTRETANTSKPSSRETTGEDIRDDSNSEGSDVGSSTQEFRSETQYYDLADLKVILSYNGEQYCFLVASHALCMASKVWKRIIHPNGFRELETEPHGSDGATIKVIRLEDDAANTLDMVFSIIHLRTESIPKNLSFRRLRQLAIICDKYECGKALGPWPGMWMQEHIANAMAPGFEDWLFIAKVLDPTQMRAKEISRNLVLEAGSKSICGSYMKRYATSSETQFEVNLDLMPDKIKERAHALRKVIKMLRQFVGELSCVSFNDQYFNLPRPITFCRTCSDIALGSLMRSLKGLFLWPLVHGDKRVEWHGSLQVLVDRIECVHMTTLIHRTSSHPVVPARVSSFTATGRRASSISHKRISSTSTISNMPFIGPSNCNPPVEEKLKITREARSDRPNKTLDYGYASVMQDLRYEHPAFHKDSYHRM
ncbi:hypothetical protein ABW21_db0209788 [Orbilia brochopaga]|nr:hypothetical protein ABW21_db0209788 [Drechslerella brochopaga]